VSCQHEQSDLKTEVVGIGPGSTHIVRCECGEAWRGAPAFELLASRLSEQIDHLWRALENKGIKRPRRPQPPEPQEKAPCSHFHGWLQVKVSGRNYFVICVGCKETWTGGAAFKKYTDSAFQEVQEIKKSVAKLGG